MTIIKAESQFKQFVHNGCKWELRSFTFDRLTHGSPVIVWIFGRFELSRNYSVNAEKYIWDLSYNSSHCNFSNGTENPFLALEWVVDNDKVNNVVLAYLVGS
jgi:hypothetical protein